MHLNTAINPTSKQHSVRAWFVLLAFAAMIVLAACGGTTNTGTTPTPTQAGNTPTTTPSGSTMAVSITNSSTFAFSPATITIKVGTTVTWTNNTGAPHTVTSDDSTSFDSGINTPIAATGGTYSFTFTKAGTFNLPLPDSPLHEGHRYRPVNSRLTPDAHKGRPYISSTSHPSPQAGRLRWGKVRIAQM